MGWFPATVNVHVPTGRSTGHVWPQLEGGSPLALCLSGFEPLVYLQGSLHQTRPISQTPIDHQRRRLRWAIIRSCPSSETRARLLVVLKHVSI